MSELVGKSIGPYQILEQIGRGGMASVFKAYHPTTDRLVAVKTLPPELASNPDFRIRFEREARIVANLNHIHKPPGFCSKLPAPFIMPTNEA
jgi:serine/threonine protein kinase